MDQEITRLVLALVLTGLVLFVWNYYRSAFEGKSSDPAPTVTQTEKVDEQGADVRKDLSQYKNCGWLKIVVYPIYKALEYINRRIENIGISLIFITLVIRILLAPLMIKQVISSKTIAGLKDEMEKIKSRYKENPLEMQKAVGNLFRKKGINPLWNFGLALIQVPLFYALYKIVHEADIFSGANLGLWIHDLGAADPYFILPCLAGLMMLLATRLTGNTGPRAPSWLLYLFSILFIFFLLNQPAGLALYILVGSIFQQVVYIASDRFIDPKEKQV